MAGYGNGYGPSGQGQDIPMQDRSHCKYPPSLRPWNTGEFLSRCQKAQWCKGKPNCPKITSYTNHAFNVYRALGGCGCKDRTNQIMAWPTTPNVLVIVGRQEYKAIYWYYTDTYTIEMSQALQFDMAHFFFNSWNVTCFSCFGFSVLYIDNLYMDM